LLSDNGEGVAVHCAIKKCRNKRLYNIVYIYYIKQHMKYRQEVIDISRTYLNTIILRTEKIVNLKWTLGKLTTINYFIFIENV